MPVAIVTGASRGFGRAVAVDLAQSGWALIVDGRSPGPLGDLARSIEDLGASARAIVGDVTDPEHRTALVEAAASLGSLDLLVNNASTLGPSPLPALEDFPMHELREIYEANAIAPLALIQEAMPLLRRSKGIVVSVTSDASVEGYEGWGGYGSSKAALDQLHRVLAVEVPELVIYTFDPGDMRTDMHQAAYPGEDISDRPLPETIVPKLRRLIDSGLPSGRYRAADWS